MKGNILDFNDMSRTGLITGEDGNRYMHDVSEWKGSVLPKAGQKVDFTVSGTMATAVYLDSAGSASLGNSKKLPAALFAFFLGAFGAHKFYLGYTKQGVIMLLCFLFGFILLGIPSFIIGVIAFIEFILYLVKSEEDFEKTYVIGKKGWF
jgi:TM2 domain-containing membrane protein YozV